MNEQGGISWFFKDLYQGFSLPLSEIDCGQKCGSYNDYGVPVCCDIRLVIPTAFLEEWKFLESETDLWRPWEKLSSQEGQKLADELQSGQTTLQCLGYQDCQRSFRTISCRSFPFFPYLDSAGKLIGLTFYREYRQDCWIISNLNRVTLEYKKQFQDAYQKLFEVYSDARTNYQNYCEYVRRSAGNDQEDLVLLDFDGRVFLINPRVCKVQETSYCDLTSYGPFGVMNDLVFPDEEESNLP
jgi:hypothetical protein